MEVDNALRPCNFSSFTLKGFTDKNVLFVPVLFPFIVLVLVDIFCDIGFAKIDLKSHFNHK